jgi:hypothetical protein
VIAGDSHVISSTIVSALFVQRNGLAVSLLRARWLESSFNVIGNETMFAQ